MLKNPGNLLENLGVLQGHKEKVWCLAWYFANFAFSLHFLYNFRGFLQAPVLRPVCLVFLRQIYTSLAEKRRFLRVFRNFRDI